MICRFVFVCPFPLDGANPSTTLGAACDDCGSALIGTKSDVAILLHRINATFNSQIEFN